MTLADGYRPLTGDHTLDNVDDVFDQTAAEVKKMSSRAPADRARTLSLVDKLSYSTENRVASNPKSKFYFLFLVVFLFCVLFSALWSASSDSNETFLDAMYAVLQIIATGCVSSEDESPFRRFVFLASMFTGCCLFAVLVGFINDSVSDFMESMNKGHSKVAVSGHTLVLGWNEATLRVVCQLAFLRRAALIQNETCMRRLLPCTRVAPSTPVACAPIVLMCNHMEKAEMDAKLEQALLERGISPGRTKVGTDVVCRIGNPTEPHDLLMVGANRAKSILVMMTTEDASIQSESAGLVKCGASLRTLLALRNVIFGEVGPRQNNVDAGSRLRVVVQLESSSETIEAAKFVGPDGSDAVQCLDMTSFVNTLMFNCASLPGLSSVLMDLMSFEGFGFRSKDASRLGLVGRNIGSCALIWTDAVICGVVDTRMRLDENQAHPQHGLACDPDRIITECDRVIFVAESTFPRAAKVADTEKVAPLRNTRKTVVHNHEDILVCGWRHAWSNDPKRLAARIDGLAYGLGLGSCIVFLNSLSGEDFDDLMNKGGFKRGVNGLWMKHDVSLKHEQGDATDIDTLRKVLSAGVFECAVVLGTVAGSEAMSATTQDSRVLSIMCLLRQVNEELGRESDMHIVAENLHDSAAMLALQPRHTSLPDFVNTQGIYARALVQALSYPVMHTALKQLFQEQSGMPRLSLVPVGHGLFALGPATFAQITVALMRRHPGAVCLGYMLGKGGSIVYAPAPEDAHDYQEGDMLIIIQR